MYECRPHLCFSEWNEGGKKIDSDIQIYNGNSIDFTKNTVDPSKVNLPGLRMKRCKMIGHYWNSSKDLIDEFRCMIPEDTYIYDQLEFTSSDENIDYYIIINKPLNETDYYDASRSIVFQMEPYGHTKFWGKWAEPKVDDFFAVYSHKTQLNAVQWQFRIPSDETIRNTTKIDKIGVICSNRNVYTGHILRNSKPLIVHPKT